MLITLAALWGDVWHIIGTSVFVGSLILLYTASTVYHAVPVAWERARPRLRVFDHCAIYVLIAGTYTPFALVGLRGPWGWSLFIASWALAAAGIVFKLFFTGRFNLLSTLLYIAMGWLILIAVKPLIGRAGDPDADVDRRGRPGLHRQVGLLPLAADPVRPRHLAPLRSRGERVPLRGRADATDAGVAAGQKDEDDENVGLWRAGLATAPFGPAATARAGPIPRDQNGGASGRGRRPRRGA